MFARLIPLFFVKVIAVYAVLMLPWFGDAYGAIFRAGANVVFRTVGGDGRAYFRPNPDTEALHGTAVRVENARTGVGGMMEPGLNTRNLGFLATAFLIALVTATPIPWRRRLIALGIGLVLISLFAAFRLYLELLDVFSDPSPLQAYSLGPFWKKAVLILKKVLSMTPVTMYIAPIFVWILVCFRRGDLAPFAPANAGGSPSDSPRGPARARRA